MMKSEREDGRQREGRLAPQAARGVPQVLDERVHADLDVRRLGKRSSASPPRILARYPGARNPAGIFSSMMPTRHVVIATCLAMTLAEVASPQTTPAASQKPATRRSQRVQMPDVDVPSPNGQVTFTFLPNAERLTFTVRLGDTTVIEPSSNRHRSSSPWSASTRRFIAKRTRSVSSCAREAVFSRGSRQ